MVTLRERMPVAWRNLSQARTWRVQDMVNWHRMVKPLRGEVGADLELDLFPLVVDLCTRFCFHYEPLPYVGRDLVRGCEEGTRRPGEPRVALFVDAAGHLSGVSTTIGQWRDGAAAAGQDLVVHTAGTDEGLGRAVAFTPVGTLQMPLYDGLQLHVPHVKTVMDYMARARFDVVHLSTPGPMGLLGLLAARRLGLPVCGTYHTDFPSYALRLSRDPALEDVTWQYMRWFYGQLDRVASPSPSTRDHVVAHGFEPMRQTVVGRGVDTTSFRPSLRRASLRRAWGPHRTKLLYVGRVSEEKNLYCLAQAFRSLRERGADVDLVIVGDGPYRGALECELAGTGAVFTGTLRGEALAAAYASADLFVFPSETDTFGVVLIEAQASGLPAIVAEQGGPKDCIRPGETGFVVDPMTPAALADRIATLVEDPAALAARRDACVAHAAAMTPEASFETFWRMHADLMRPATAPAHARVEALRPAAAVPQATAT